MADKQTALKQNTRKLIPEAYSGISLGNESVPKNTTNDTTNLLFKTAISILVISSHNRFRVLFDKIASVYFI